MRRRGSTGGRGRLGAVVDVMRQRDLRRLQLGWAAFFLVDGISTVALAVWAFGRGGGSAVGFVGLARLLPGAMALPVGAWAADRFARRSVVTSVFAATAATQGAIAVALAADAPSIVIYVLVAASSIAVTPYRSAQLALTPLVARSAEELVAMNVTAGTIEGLATFVGPALAALLLIAAEPPFVTAVAAAAGLAGLLAVVRIRVDVDPSKAVRQDRDRPLRGLTGGFAELRRNSHLAVLVACFVAQLVVRGFLTVLLVLVSFDLVDLGSSGVGWLAATMGIGGIAGGIYAIALTGRRRLARPFTIAIVMWGLPIAVVGILPDIVIVLVALFTIGSANAILDVSGFTLIQRLGSDRNLGRVFGVLFTVGIALGGLGSLAAPVLVSGLGLRPVLILVGMVLPTLAVALLPRLRAIDRHSEPASELVSLFSGIALLAPLPPTALEKIAARCSTAEVPMGSVIVAEGDHGDRFYGIVEGRVEVARGGVLQATLGPGDHFGEIALLRQTTRTATVVAVSDVRVATLGTADFLDALVSCDAAYGIAWRGTEEMLSRPSGAG
ncbi:MAG: cyclic nucleotide-binding domain-containing protein [Actinomycetota bacterium]|nr:cyclic nucleotide-binding domain-containing protein [Actinomycetota bacterium]